MSAVSSASYYFLSESQLQLIPPEKRKSFYHHRHKLDFGRIVFHLLTDKKSDVPWRYLKYTHIRKLLWLWFDVLLFQFKIQVNFSRSIIVTGGPWLVIGQRVLSLVSHWSSLSLLCSDDGKVTPLRSRADCHFTDQLHSWLRLHSERNIGTQKKSMISIYTRYVKRMQTGTHSNFFLIFIIEAFYDCQFFQIFNNCLIV